MVTVVNNPGPNTPAPNNNDSSAAGWAVAVIILIIVIGGLFWYFHYYRAAAPASNPVIQVNVPGGSNSGTPATGTGY